MIITAQVKHTVHEQCGEFLLRRSPALSCPTKRRRNRDDDIPQQRRTRVVGFPHRKGQHVGRSILAAVDPIQSAHATIAYQLDAQFRGRFTGRRQDLFGKAHKPGLLESWLSEPEPNVHSHLVRLAEVAFGRHPALGRNAAGCMGGRRRVAL